MSGTEQDYRVSSGNVFADLGYPDAEQALLKSRLIQAISEILADGGWSESEAAEAIGVDSPTLVALLDGRLRRFTSDQLVGYLAALDHRVEISVVPSVRTQRVVGSASRTRTRAASPVRASAEA